MCEFILVCEGKSLGKEQHVGHCVLLPSLLHYERELASFLLTNKFFLSLKSEESPFHGGKQPPVASLNHHKYLEPYLGKNNKVITHA